METLDWAREQTLLFRRGKVKAEGLEVDEEEGVENEEEGVENKAVELKAWRVDCREVGRAAQVVRWERVESCFCLGEGFLMSTRTEKGFFVSTRTEGGVFCICFLCCGKEEF